MGGLGENGSTFPRSLIIDVLSVHVAVVRIFILGVVGRPKVTFNPFGL